MSFGLGREEVIRPGMSNGENWAGWSGPVSGKRFVNAPCVAEATQGSGRKERNYSSSFFFLGFSAVLIFSTSTSFMVPRLWERSAPSPIC